MILNHIFVKSTLEVSYFEHVTIAIRLTLASLHFVKSTSVDSESQTSGTRSSALSQTTFRRSTECHSRLQGPDAELPTLYTVFVGCDSWMEFFDVNGGAMVLLER